jgi:transposase InsO family protein
MRAPRANALVERFLGSVRRECLNHLLILGERHLARALAAYTHYFNGARLHQGIDQRVPKKPPRPAATPNASRQVRAVPVLGGLHYDYKRAA